MTVNPQPTTSKQLHHQQERDCMGDPLAQLDSTAHSPAGHAYSAGVPEPLNSEPGFRGVDVPAEADLYRCVHCGLCLSSCPTYTTLKVETESPRGRIALMRAVHEGRVGISDRIVSHWEMCLQCRACEAVCPSGVPYGRIMEYTRAQTLSQDKQGAALKRVDRFFLRAALPHPGRLRFGAHLLRIYQRSGLRSLVRASRLLRLLPESLRQMEAQLPDLREPFFGPTGEVHPARARQIGGDAAATAPAVALLSGCVMPVMQGDTMRAAVRVLTRNGCDVAVPIGQVCCGALNLHAGDLETARRLARKNIDVFLAPGADTPGYRIVTASAGCGSNMKEYGELLKHDPEYAEPARRFAELTVDITEFLAGLPLDPPGGAVNRRVTYQDPLPPGPRPAHHPAAEGSPGDHPRPGTGGNGGGVHVLRGRRILLHGAARRVGAHPGNQGGQYRGHRRRAGGYRQPRLHDADRAGPGVEGLPCCRPAGRPRGGFAG